MKKKIGKLIAGLIVLTMVISSTGLAFADKESTENPNSEPTSQSSLKLEIQDVSKAATNLENTLETENITRLGDAAGSIAVPIWKTGTESELESLIYNNISYISYAMSGNTLSGTYDKYGAAKTAYLPKGTVIIYAMVDECNGEYAADAYLGVFRDANMTSAVDGTINVIEDRGATFGVFNVPASGTYYIGAYSNKSNNDAKQIDILLSAVSVSGLDRTVYSGSQISVGQKTPQTNYFTFTATKNGYIKVELSEDIKGRVTLCSSSKKALSDRSAATRYIVYGVKKGTKYTIRVEAPTNSSGGYNFKVTNVGIKESSGSSKSKAKTISRGSSKAKSGTIVAGSSTSDWYKFKLTKKKAVKIVMSGATNKSIKVSIYKGSKLIKSSKLNSYHSKVTLTSNGKLAKGTYYIKISRTDKYSSGYYKCYWNYR